jgi:serine/threonine-protein kinase ATR
MLATRHTNGFEPPPSSILATHVAHGNGTVAIDPETFEQLLAEALGSGEQDQPNLGADAAFNHKLICIVLRLGIDSAHEEDPFRSVGAIGREDAQLETCLEVVRSAVQRAPQVLFEKSDIQGDEAESGLLYTRMIPSILPLLATTKSNQVTDAALRLLNTLIQADRSCNRLSRADAVLEFIRGLVSGK